MVFLWFLFVSSKLTQAKHQSQRQYWHFSIPVLFISPQYCIHRTSTLWELSLTVSWSTSSLLSFLDISSSSILSKVGIIFHRFLIPETHVSSVNLRKPNTRHPKSPELPPCSHQERLLDQLYPGDANICRVNHVHGEFCSLWALKTTKLSYKNIIALLRAKRHNGRHYLQTKDCHVGKNPSPWVPCLRVFLSHARSLLFTM